jgi:hypothetical protein
MMGFVTFGFGVRIEITCVRIPKLINEQKRHPKLAITLLEGLTLLVRLH